MRVRLLNLTVAAAVGARGGPRARRGLATIYAMVSAATIFGDNKIDGQTLSLNTATDVTSGTWSGGSFTSSTAASADAIKVTKYYDVPMMWATLMGRASCRVQASATVQASSSTPTYG